MVGSEFPKRGQIRPWISALTCSREPRILEMAEL